jgi:hypothetical protein
MTYIKAGQTLVALGAIALAAASCTDLTEVVYDEVTEENFNPTEADIGSLIAPAYTPLRGFWMSWVGGVDVFEETSDILLTPVRPNGWRDNGIYISLHQHTWTPTFPYQIGSKWTGLYDGVTAANRIIFQIESGVAAIDDEDLKTRVLAELRAVRAYYYSHLLDLFGNVPIATDFSDTELPATSSQQEVFDFVVAELQAAIPDLSSEGPGTNTYGRMNAWAAKAILARVYLNAEVYTGTPHYEEVLPLTDDIMQSGLYELESEYRAPFARNNDQSIENIWVVPYDEVNGGESNFHMKTLKPELRFVFNMSSQPWGGSAANPQFIDTYDPDDTRLAGTPAEQGRGGTWLAGPQFTSDDEFGYEFVQHVPEIDPPQAESRFDYGFPVWKYEIYPGMTASSDVDYPIVRYAEVLMMRAEALLRTGDAGGAAALVSQVRQRAFAGTDPAKATVTGAELMQGSRYNYGWYDKDGVVKSGPGGSPTTDGGADIQYGRFLDELGWEFAAEGHRRTQLIRFGAFTTKTWFNHEPQGDYRTLWPIPQFALDTNPNLSQNPGY